MLDITLDLNGLRLPARLCGDPETVEGGLLLPPGQVSILHPFGATRFFRHGWNSWSPTAWWSLAQPPLRIPTPERLLTADDIEHDSLWRHTGSAVGALQGPDGKVLLLGGLGLGVPRIDVDQRTVGADAEHADAPWFLAYGPEAEVFEHYAHFLATRHGRREQRAGSIWCSWYSFFEDITEPLLHKVLDGLTGHSFDVVQIDDGWQQCVGDWFPSADFPSGMADLAARIRAAGFRPGLWLAPLIAPAHSRIFRERPHLFLKDSTGQPKPAGHNWGSPYFALDTTLPEAAEHLVDTVRRAVGWGFDYLKLDFLYAGALAARRHDDIPREVAYREAAQLIRDAVGDSTYLLGSGAPILPSIGLFDGIRVGPDVAPYWDNSERSTDYSGAGARNAVIASLHRTWLRPLYEIDPDVVFFRRRYNLLDDQCRQILADLAAVCDFRATSDPMDWLDETETEELDRFLTARPTVHRVERFRYLIDDREVDFTPFVEPDGRLSDRILVK